MFFIIHNRENNKMFQIVSLVEMRAIDPLLSLAYIYEIMFKMCC